MVLKTEARKPLYAYAGVIDLAVEKTRELPAKATTVVPKAQVLVAEFPTKALGQAKELRTQLESRTTTLTLKTLGVYGGLVNRGEKLVGSIRRQQATQEAVTQVKSAKSRTKAAATSASKAAKATAAAVEDAAEKIG